MDTQSTSWMTRLDRAAERPLIWVFMIGAAAVGIVGAVVGLVGLVSSRVTDRIPLTLLAEAPVPTENQGTAEVVDGGFQTAQVVVSGLSAGPIWLTTLGSATGILTGLVISASVVLMCWRLLRRRPFGRSLTVLVLTLGCVLVLGTIVSQGFGGLGHMMAAAELNADEPGFWPLASILDLTPLFFGLSLFMVAVLLQYGERMQRDTEGLV